MALDLPTSEIIIKFFLIHMAKLKVEVKSDWQNLEWATCSWGGDGVITQNWVVILIQGIATAKLLLANNKELYVFQHLP